MFDDAAEDSIALDWCVERDDGDRIAGRWGLAQALVRAVIAEMVHVVIEDDAGVSFVVDQQFVGALFADTADAPLSRRPRLIRDA